MKNILEVNNLRTVFSGRRGIGAAVDGVSFAVGKGETVCIVGESGCGKSVSCLSLLGLLPRNGKVAGGSALFDGQNLFAMSEHQLDAVRGAGIGMVFQDALSALNPVLTVGSQLTESVRAHHRMDRAAAQARAVALLEKVGLPDPAGTMKKYPHTLSGGQRQRTMIAMALAGEPKLLIADEPTTALDVTIQAQIMALLKRLQSENGMALLLITHDIGLVAQMADRVIVMYAGQIVEQADVKTLFRCPAHPYTQALLRSVPDFTDGRRRLDSIQGSVPEHYQDIRGCRFASRCPYAAVECENPQTERTLSPGHTVCCGIAKEEQA